MRVITVIDDATVIRKILQHMNRWNPAPECRFEGVRGSRERKGFAYCL